MKLGIVYAYHSVVGVVHNIIDLTEKLDSY